LPARDDTRNEVVVESPNAHGPDRLLEVATELNQRPRKTLNGNTPAAALERLLSDPPEPTVATTA
jgi:IS30 family transposase